jgi:RNA polymerase sigma factor for flagellar operon FliA
MNAAAAIPADVDARDRLVMAHVSLVKVLAQRLAQRLPAQVEFNELISVGVLGLVEAANRYQPTLGVPFDAFARRRIHGAMLDALRNLDWAPRSMRRLRRDLDSTIARLRHELGREPNEAEIAEAMNFTGAQFDKAMEQLRTLEAATIRPLDAIGPDGESLLDVAVDPEEGPAAQLERGELRRRLARAIQDLPERERQILALSYEEELTLAEISKVIGVSESRVCQLRTLAVSRLRTSLSAGLHDEHSRRAAAAAVKAVAGRPAARQRAAG